MFTFEWIADALEFVPDAILIGLLFLSYWFVTTKVEFLKRIKSRNMNQHQKGYATYGDSNGYDHVRDCLSHNDDSNDSDMFSYMKQKNDESEERFYAESTGEFILRGGSHEDLDYSNPNHYPIIDSYDNSSDKY